MRPRPAARHIDNTNAHGKAGGAVMPTNCSGRSIREGGLPAQKLSLIWPIALGRRPLLVFESYDRSVWNLPGLATSNENDLLAFLEHGFELLVPDRWTFPYLDDHGLAIHYVLELLALVNEAADLFIYPLTDLPEDWFSHLKYERSCLPITGVDLHLATAAMQTLPRSICLGDPSR